MHAVSCRGQEEGENIRVLCMPNIICIDIATSVGEEGGDK